MMMARPIAPDDAATLRSITVGMGQFALARCNEHLRTLGLGSCIAVIIFAPRQQLAALAHCMLPTADQADGSPAKFVQTAVPTLLTQLEASGGSVPFAAALVGGASRFPGVPTEFMRDIAGQNIAAARDALAAAAVPIRHEDVGGQVGRSVLVDPATQRVMVHTIRGGDRWL